MVAWTEPVKLIHWWSHNPAAPAAVAAATRASVGACSVAVLPAVVVAVAAAVVMVTVMMVVNGNETETQRRTTKKKKKKNKQCQGCQSAKDGVGLTGHCCDVVRSVLIHVIILKVQCLMYSSEDDHATVTYESATE